MPQFACNTLLVTALLLTFSCSPEDPPPPEKTPAEKLDQHLDLFFQEWQEQNERFKINVAEIDIVFSENNQTDGNSSVQTQFPFNWTEFQYQEESDFAQGYDSIIQVASHISILHNYADGNWSFTSARQSDFNATLVDVADDYSRIIADAWVKRLPEARDFSDKEKLFQKTPTKMYRLP
ncbi:MAG TPA: hypothetical protein DCF87_03890 [Opitutae bacterium]|nr:hypothetical protein [Opitutae bacterium]